MECCCGDVFDIGMERDGDGMGWHPVSKVVVKRDGFSEMAMVGAGVFFGSFSS